MTEGTMNKWDKLINAMSDLEDEDVMNILEKFIRTNPSADEGKEVIAACQQGMGIVGKRFEEGEYFVGDLIFSGELITDVVNKLKPIIGGDSNVNAGTILLGTVKGDVHDIGKNIFKSLSEAAGFKVVDLGVDQSANDFVEKAKELKPDIIGMSGILTLAVDSMKDTVIALKASGINSKVILGGNPVTKETCEFVGADGFTTNAAEGVKICQGWVG